MRVFFPTINLLLALGIVLLTFWVWPQLPDSIPVHWGLDGQPDRFGERGAMLGGLVFLGFTAVVVWGALRAQPGVQQSAPALTGMLLLPLGLVLDTATDSGLLTGLPPLDWTFAALGGLLLLGRVLGQATRPDAAGRDASQQMQKLLQALGLFTLLYAALPKTTMLSWLWLLGLLLAGVWFWQSGPRTARQP